MKSHHVRHTRYLLIALGMIGLIFWQRETMSDWIDQIRQKDDIAISIATDATTTNEITITKTDPALPLPTDTADAVTSGAVITGTTIVIGKHADTAPVPVSSGSIIDTDVTTGAVVTTTDTHISDTITNTGTVVDTDITLVSTGATTDESVVSPSDRIVIQPRQSGRTLRQGKQFAYELANALEIGTGEMLTTIDGYYDTQTLYDAWEQTQDTQIYHALIDRLESEYQYDDMVALLASHTNLRTTDTPDRYVRALGESSQVDVTRPDTIQVIQDTLYNMEQTGVMPSIQMDRYNLLINTRNTGMNSLVVSVASIPDQSLHDDIQKVLDYYTTQQHVPEYYRDTLVAMVLVQYGYFHLAEKTALQVIAQDPGYILPRQILAYSSFTKRDRTQSLVYLQELIERDPDNSEFYTFLRGIVIYRQGDYAAAALTLRQTQNPRYLPDAVRYLALAYDHLDDITQRDQAFTALLQYSLDPSDYYTYFYLTFFQPFQEGDFQTQSIVLDTTTAQEYVRRCTESLSGDARIVCEYGAAGVLLASGDLETAHNTLLQLYDKYPYSYIAHALGDYYTMQGETQKAMRYYFLALRSTDSTAERDLAKQKIWELTQGDSDI